jgi:hypothetical protein
MNGVVSYFASHKPSSDDLDNCKWIVISSDIPWDPNDPSWERQERAMDWQVAKISEVLTNGDRHPDGQVRKTDSHFVFISEPPEILDDEEFATRLIQSVNIVGDDWTGTAWMDTMIRTCTR